MIMNIPCPHETGAATRGEPGPDYHPLTREEVTALLEVGCRAEHPRLREQVQVRLGQAIPGMECPWPLALLRRLCAVEEGFLECVAQCRRTAPVDADFFATWGRRMMRLLTGQEERL
jgi:hypothetical protein